MVVDSIEKCRSTAGRLILTVCWRAGNKVQFSLVLVTQQGAQSRGNKEDLSIFVVTTCPNVTNLTVRFADDTQGK